MLGKRCLYFILLVFRLNTFDIITTAFVQNVDMKSEDNIVKYSAFIFHYGKDGYPEILTLNINMDVYFS